MRKWQHRTSAGNYFTLAIVLTVADVLLPPVEAENVALRCSFNRRRSPARWPTGWIGRGRSAPFAKHFQLQFASFWVRLDYREFLIGPSNRC
uniref:Putative secreted protein n=1 Tax=Anopheles marajoara TaxID=58244 RepID=A0A2M4C9Q8_9DIPT